MDRRLAGALLSLAAAACKGPVVQSPLTGQSRYLCCNVRYERPEITDNFYTVGTMIPVGTRVEILEVRRDRVRFRPEGHPEITLVYEWGRKTVPFETFLSRVFVEIDPRERLVTGTGRGGRGTSSRLALVERGVVEPGMTRDEVIMAVAYPPAHRTPSLDLPEWRYWRNRFDQYAVVFEGDRVARIDE